jgi:rubrerythrin
MSVESFNPASFVEYYRRNFERPRPYEAKSEEYSTELPLAKQKALVSLLTKLALGESAEGGMGTNLAGRTNDQEDAESLRWYVLEEKRHGEELARLIALLKVDALVSGSRFDPAILITKSLNFGRVIDVSNILLVAEVLTLALYREIANRAGHPLVKAVLAEIIRDEAGHVRYHAARLRSALQRKQGRGVLKAVHRFGLVVWLFSVYFVIWRDVRLVTGLTWSELLDIFEKDYQKFFGKSEMSFFASRWIFGMVRRLTVWKPSRKVTN